MTMYKKEKPVYEKNSGKRVKDFEVKNTRVSEYLRKYGTGHLDRVPTDNRQEITDDRTPEEMLSDGFEPAQFGTDELDVMMELEKNKEKFEAAAAEIELTKKEKARYDELMKIYNDKSVDADTRFKVYNEIKDLLDKRNSRARS